MKKNKFIIKTSKSSIPCDQDELPKVFQAITAGTPVILKQGWFNPSFFDSVVQDDDWMRKYQDDNKYDIRAGEITEYPAHEDKFKEIREQIKQLSNNLKQLN
jgi:hypothetical protein